MPLIKCEVFLTLIWYKNFVLTISETFTINYAQLYVPVVTISIGDDKKLLQQLKQDLKQQLNGINTDQK